MTVWYSVHDFYLEGGSRLLIELTGKLFFIIWKTVHFLCPVRYFVIKVCLVVIVGFSPQCEVVFTKLANRGICRHSNGPIVSQKTRAAGAKCGKSRSWLVLACDWLEKKLCEYF